MVPVWCAFQRSNMDGLLRQSYVSQTNAPTVNPRIDNGDNSSSYSPQSFIISFPPPAAPASSPANPQFFGSDSNMSTMQPVHSFPRTCESTTSTNILSAQGNAPIDIKHDTQVNEVTGMFQSTMSLNGNDCFSNKMKDAIGVSGLNAMEFTGLYPVLLTPSSFMHSVCGSGSQPMYQQFGHNVQSQLSQLHSMYSVNVMSQRDQVGSNPPVASMSPVCSLECSNPPMNNQLLDTTREGYIPHIQVR